MDEMMIQSFYRLFSDRPDPLQVPDFAIRTLFFKIILQMKNAPVEKTPTGAL